MDRQESTNIHHTENADTRQHPGKEDRRVGSDAQGRSIHGTSHRECDSRDSRHVGPSRGGRTPSFARGVAARHSVAFSAALACVSLALCAAVVRLKFAVCPGPGAASVAAADLDPSVLERDPSVDSGLVALVAARAAVVRFAPDAVAADSALAVVVQDLRAVSGRAAVVVALVAIAGQAAAA